jgi:DNA-binding NarL/FixJ family response regulator
MTRRFQADAANAGASACLPSEACEHECLSTIGAAMAGHQLFSREVLSLAFRPIELTSREREVLQLLAQGKTDREIADVLVLGLTTARKHSHSILEKLGVHERREAVRRARRLGWV